MAHKNGFFGSLQGPFAAREQLITKIQQQCLTDSFQYISKLGIHSVRNFDLDITGTYYPQTIIIINNIEFILGKTGILQLENCQITSIKFKEDTDDKVYIDYQYE